MKLEAIEHNVILAALTLYKAARFQAQPVERVTVEPDLAREVEALADADGGHFNAFGVDSLMEKISADADKPARYLYVTCEAPTNDPHCPGFRHAFLDALDDSDAYSKGGKLLDASRAADSFMLNDYVVELPQPDAACLIIVHGGVADVEPSPAVYAVVIDQDNIEAGDAPPELPRGEGFEKLLEKCSGLEEGRDYTWMKDDE